MKLWSFFSFYLFFLQVVVSCFAQECPSEIFTKNDLKYLVHQTPIKNYKSIIQSGYLSPGSLTGVINRLENDANVYLEAIDEETYEGIKKIVSQSPKLTLAYLVFDLTLLDDLQREFPKKVHFSRSWNHFGKYHKRDSAYFDEIKKLEKLVGVFLENPEDYDNPQNEIVYAGKIPLAKYLKESLVPPLHKLSP